MVHGCDPANLGVTIQLKNVEGAWQGFSAILSVSVMVTCLPL
jgi:hypothetical protein